jgi:hypothetical protein
METHIAESKIIDIIILLRMKLSPSKIAKASSLPVLSEHDENWPINREFYCTGYF